MLSSDWRAWDDIDDDMSLYDYEALARRSVVMKITFLVGGREMGLVLYTTASKIYKNHIRAHTTTRLPCSYHPTPIRVCIAQSQRTADV